MGQANSFKGESDHAHKRERLIIDQQNDILKLTKELKEAKKKQELAEQKIKRIAQEVNADKPVPVRLNNIQKIMTHREEYVRRFGFDLPKKRKES